MPLCGMQSEFRNEIFPIRLLRYLVSFSAGMIVFGETFGVDMCICFRAYKESRYVVCFLL